MTKKNEKRKKKCVTRSKQIEENITSAVNANDDEEAAAATR